MVTDHSLGESLQQADKGGFCPGEFECRVKAPAMKMCCAASAAHPARSFSVVVGLQYVHAGADAPTSRRALSFPTPWGSGELSVQALV